MVFDDVAVLTHPGVASRRGEVASTARALDGLGLEIARIVPSGTLDGGDVLEVGRTAYVGHGSRTNAEGIRQLAALVEPRGWTVVPVPVRTVLHLKSAVTALPDGTVIGRRDGTAALAEPDDPAPSLDPVAPERPGGSPWSPGLVVPEEHGTAVVDLGDGAVLMSADAPRTAALHRARGLDVVTVPISEFEKLEGCVTCLSVRLRR